MPKYVTVAQYRAADDGLPNVSGMLDTSIARFIQRAEASIDSYIGFDLSLGGFEPHIAWIQHQWDIAKLKSRISNWPVPVRQITRYRIQVSNLSTAGAGFFANINTSDVVINEFDAYLEIVPLQAITYSLAPVILQLGLRPPIVQVDYEVGFNLPVFGEVASSTDSQTYSALRGFWSMTYTQAIASQPNKLPPIPPNVYVNGMLQSASTYTVNPTEGYVRFNSVTPGTVTIDYTYTIPDEVTAATIAQTTWMLAQRDLNQMQLKGLDRARSGERDIYRQKANEEGLNWLVNEALHLVKSYKIISVQ